MTDVLSLSSKCYYVWYCRAEFNNTGYCLLTYEYMISDCPSIGADFNEDSIQVTFALISFIEYTCSSL
jgi:hypothetical protein